jgi:rubrerythrin
MNWKIFFSTFALIFLAELGDKTQLAALARTATAGSAKWTIFAAASSALVVSTLVAVLIGGVLTRWVPERYIKLAAGALFVLFGLLILREAWLPRKAEAGSSKAKGVASLIFHLAAEFEKAAFGDYRHLAGEARHPELRALLEALAAEEDAHYQKILEVSHEHPDLKLDTASEQGLLASPQLIHDVAGDDRPVLEHAMEHERATSRFYTELARLTPAPALKQAFLALAGAENDHLRRLQSLAGISRQLPASATSTQGV